MRAPAVVIQAPAFDDSAGASDIQKPAGVQTFIAKYSVERFDKSVLHRTSGSMKRSSTRRCSHHAFNARQTNSGPWSTRISSGRSLSAKSRSRTRITRKPGRLVSTSMASDSRLNSSTTVRARNVRPSASVSLTKSSPNADSVVSAALFPTPRASDAAGRGGGFCVASPDPYRGKDDKPPCGSRVCLLGAIMP